MDLLSHFILFYFIKTNALIFTLRDSILYFYLTIIFPTNLIFTLNNISKTYELSNSEYENFFKPYLLHSLKLQECSKQIISTLRNSNGIQEIFFYKNLNVFELLLAMS